MYVALIWSALVALSYTTKRQTSTLTGDSSRLIHIQSLTMTRSVYSCGSRRWPTGASLFIANGGRSASLRRAEPTDRSSGCSDRPALTAAVANNNGFRFFIGSRSMRRARSGKIVPINHRRGRRRRWNIKRGSVSLGREASVCCHLTSRRASSIPGRPRHSGRAAPRRAAAPAGDYPSPFNRRQTTALPTRTRYEYSDETSIRISRRPCELPRAPQLDLQELLIAWSRTDWWLCCAYSRPIAVIVINY